MSSSNVRVVYDFLIGVRVIEYIFSGSYQDYIGLYPTNLYW
jgi:hypothetical protein